MFIRNYLCLLAFFAFISTAAAQENASIYIQTENNMPCTARWNGNTYTSSPTGIIVIPQVGRGVQTFDISFLPDISADYSFTVMIADKPIGFSLRLAIDNRWGLFDLNTFSFIKGTAIVKPQVQFVIKDPMAKERPAEVITSPVEIPVIKIPSQLIRPTAIQKIFDKTGNTGIDQVYIIVNGARTDTIALFIPELAEAEIKPAATNPSSLISLPANKSGAGSMGILVQTTGIITRSRLSSK